jgi:membrane protease subunit HflK
MMTPSRPARTIAAGSLFLSIVFFVVTLLIGRWSGFFAVYAISYFLLASALIWLVLLIQLHQRTLAEQEKFDMAELVPEQKAGRIFQQKGEQAQLFAVAQKRLQILEKWFLPIFSAIIAAYQAAIGLFLLKGVADSNPAIGKEPLLCAICMAAVFFVSFLISKYATGMSTQPQWKPLRAGGSFLFGSGILSIATAIALALVQFKIFTVIRVIDYCVPVLLIILGIETLLNVILDIYRPRMPGLYSRAAFDSRLLGLINEPGEILHTAAGAIDYQFGFKVSQTWFYKLLERAIVPLIFFGAVTLYLLSCIVVLNPDEQAVIERFGCPKSPGGNVRYAEPGISLKWPWPIDIARKYPIKKIVELPIGFEPKTDPKTGEIVREPLLWGKEHYKKEHSILVASRQGFAGAAEGAVPVSILKANVPVQYRVKDLYNYLYKNDAPQKRLEAICYRELAKFAASATVEVDDEAALQNSLLGAGRTQAKDILARNIQQAADEAELGVEIVFLGIQGIHPTTDVAADYQKVVGAVQTKQALILEAEASRNRTLTELAGSIEDAEKLYNLHKSTSAQEHRGTSSYAPDEGFRGAGGEIFSRLREAQGYAFEKATLAEATGRRFASQVKAYRAAEEIYKREQRLLTLEEGLANIRKYVVVADVNDSQVYIVDLQEKLTPSLYELGGMQETRTK